ncbi:unnamed protein product (macronuclear) [Paramecium tetraurelia]|uniref:Methyltransferase type 11 domain-containing protein n=1 Tax=Paramecium tetraurelia TaxID=5888 RepID=A0EAQ1_PARTE|nr:uncharacterized protein GSPATT00025102001 [Paramecium tetraurelia]CAK92368.1 unnamed protein product [Paramecium tetraurelia]|eukprot:XP_001459765.1 hypothetical protein (macronuclear) [Paramecium tetraurelia strain d4-2]
MASFIQTLLTKILHTLYVIPSTIYDMIISNFLTKYSYERLVFYMKPKEILKESQILDIYGTNYRVDIDQAYVLKANNIFRNYNLGGRKLEIRYQNFYEVTEKKEGKFDAVVFSSSFMLMPKRIEALELAKSLLNPGGSIYFILTLQPDSKKNSTFLQFVEYIKPKIKYFTTIDFGSITYEKEFETLLNKSQLKVVNKEKLNKDFNIPTKIFRVFVYETKA